MGIFKRKQPIARKSYETYKLMPNISFKANWSGFNARQAILHGYKRSVWVYACVRLRANNVASIPWIVQRRVSGEWGIDKTHPLNSLIERPSPNFDWSELIRRSMMLMDLGGDAYMSKVRNGANVVKEVWPLTPDEMIVNTSKDRMIASYTYRQGSVRKEIPAEDIIHLRYTNPGDLFYGLSPLQSAARAVDIDEEGEKWQKTSLQNMAVPPSAFTLEGDVTQEQYDQAKRFVSENSGPENARKPWVIANAKWQSLAQTATDLDFIQGRKMTREEICGAYGVPLPLVGLYENATLANIDTARQILWREVLIPVLMELEGQLNRQLAFEYGPDIRLTYDLSNVEALAENYTEKVDNAQKLWSMGVPLTEINRRLELELELEGVHGADVGYLPGGLLPADFEIDGDPEPGGNGPASVVYGGDA